MGASTDVGTSMTIVVSVAIAVTTIAVFLRSYTRIALQHRFSADDYLILFSQANFYAFMYCVLKEVEHGMGKHLVDVMKEDPRDLVTAMRYWFIAQIFFLCATCTVKVSVAVFFCSLCPPRSLRLVAIGVACLSVATGLGTMIFQTFHCTPVSYFWERFSITAKGSCYDPYKSYAIIQTVNALDIVTDIMLALLPCYMVWNMTMRRVKKFGVSILLGLGSLSAIAAICRSFYFKNMLLDSSSDFTYSSFPVAVTSTAEPAVAISVVCFAHLRPLLRQIFPKSWFSIDETSSSDIPTFGRLGGRTDISIAEISLNPQLRPGTYSVRPPHWKNQQ